MQRATCCDDELVMPLEMGILYALHRPCHYASDSRGRARMKPTFSALQDLGTVMGYLILIAALGLAGTVSAQMPDTVFLEQLTWDEVRDSIAAGKTTIIVPTGG